MNIDEMIAVMEASKTKVIQARRTASSEWSDVKAPNWDWFACEYRVKPQPREFWINTYSNGSVYLHNNSEEAGWQKRCSGNTSTTIHVIEVIE